MTDLEFLKYTVEDFNFKGLAIFIGLFILVSIFLNWKIALLIWFLLAMFNKTGGMNIPVKTYTDFL